MASEESGGLYKPVEPTPKYRSIERFTPSIVKAVTKKVYWGTKRRYDRCMNIKKGRFVEFGDHFRCDRDAPYCAYIGDRTFFESYNILNIQLGDVVVGKNCGFGVFNILMGPLEIGDDTRTGPCVKIVGPHHPILDIGERKPKTVIGNNVRLTTGTIVLFGVKIGDNAVVSAGSVVTKDIPEGAFVGGNPARNLTSITNKAWSLASAKSGSQP